MTGPFCAGVEHRKEPCGEWSKQQPKERRWAGQPGTQATAGPHLGGATPHAWSSAEDYAAADVYLVHKRPLLLWPGPADDLGKLCSCGCPDGDIWAVLLRLFHLVHKSTLLLWPGPADNPGKTIHSSANLLYPDDKIVNQPAAYFHELLLILC